MLFIGSISGYTLCKIILCHLFQHDNVFYISNNSLLLRNPQINPDFLKYSRLLED